MRVLLFEIDSAANLLPLGSSLFDESSWYNLHPSQQPHDPHDPTAGSARHGPGDQTAHLKQLLDEGVA